MPFRGPSPQHGMVVPPPPVVFPPIGGDPPLLAGQSQSEQSKDPRKAVVRVLDIYLPEVFPIPGAQEFQGYYEASIAGPATGAVTTFTQGYLGPSLILPSFYSGIIRTVDIFATATAGLLATTRILYTVLVNGVGAQGWINRTFFERITQSFEVGFDAFIRLPDSAQVAAKVQVVDSNTYDVGIYVTGWYWPTSLGRQWMEGNGNYGGV
jgi:hypothetical protein